MTSQEFYTIVVLGLVGYWGTAAVIQHFKKKTGETEAGKKFANEQAENHDRTNQHERREYEERQRHEGANMPDDGRHWTAVLGVNVHASVDEIRAAYKKKISLYHPDKVSA